MPVIKERGAATPRRCGLLLSYTEAPETFGEGASCVFMVSAKDAEEYLTAKVEKHPHLLGDEEGKLLNWVRGRDSKLLEPTAVPEELDRFGYAIPDLIAAGKVSAFCPRCNHLYAASELLDASDHSQRGWNMIRVTCPEKHLLLAALGMHCAGRDEPEPLKGEPK